jgi:glycosyltransferase involved in cell wall biosynthesis
MGEGGQIVAPRHDKVRPVTVRVLVDGRPLGGAGAYRGFGRYLRGVLGPLSTRPDLEIATLVEPGVDLPDGITALPVHRRAPGRFADIEHDLRLPFDIRRHASDVFHSPGNDAPRRCERPWVQTLHDIIPMVLDHSDFKSERRRWRRFGERVRNAAAVLTDSEHVADEAMRTLGLDPKRVHVALLGVDRQFVAPTDTAALDGESPYVLLVAEYGPNKGYAEAFAVAGGLADKGLAHRLKVVGRLAPWVRPTVDGLRASAAHPDRIELLGWVPEQELVTLYQRATALIVSSRAEGFCLPAAEAMACATPVVAFRNSALTEVVADGGELVPDGDVAALIDAVAAIATDPSRRADASARALQRSGAFDWQRCADIHAEVFRSVAGRA